MSRADSWRARRRCAAASLALSGVLVPVVALAHAVVYPRSSAPGAYERYVLRVPNEKDVATTRVELTFPTEVRVISFGDVPGWRIEPVVDAANRITGVVWTGTLAPQRFVELPFIAVNPATAARLVWPAYQTYADGERVAWAGPEGAQSPASVTTVGPGSDTPGSRGIQLATWIALGSLALALIALGLALRARER